MYSVAALMCVHNEFDVHNQRLRILGKYSEFLLFTYLLFEYMCCNGSDYVKYYYNIMNENEEMKSCSCEVE